MDLVAQQLVTLRGAILQRRLRHLRIGEHFRDDGTHFFRGQRLRIDQPGGEANESRILDGLLHKVADRLLIGSLRTGRKR